MCIAKCSCIVIYILKEQEEGKKHGDRLDQETYKGWSEMFSTLKASSVATLQLLVQEEVQLLETQLVRGIPYLCVATSYRLFVFELPTQSTPWQAVPLLEMSVGEICCAKLK